MERTAEQVEDEDDESRWFAEQVNGLTSVQVRELQRRVELAGATRH